MRFATHEALRRHALVGGHILAAIVPRAAYGRGLPQLPQKRPVFWAPHEQVQVPGAAAGAAVAPAAGAAPPLAGAPPPEPMP